MLLTKPGTGLAAAAAAQACATAATVSRRQNTVTSGTQLALNEHVEYGRDERAGSAGV